jgi:Kef-type K+ transport system membrane component KefB
LELQRKVRVVAFAFITPIFFINAGLGISLELLWTSIALFGLLLALKMGTKLIALYPLAKVVARRESAYLSLLMSTGLTMDMIVATYGYHKQILTQAQFSVFAAAVIASAVLPTIVAQKFFHPQHLKTKITKNTKHPN